MSKKGVACLSVAVAGLLSATGIAAAEDNTYYGSGDGTNTGDISGVNWVLNGDYNNDDGRQWFFNAYTLNGTASDSLMTINGGTFTVNGSGVAGSNTYVNYFYGGFTRANGNATDSGIVINNGNFVNKTSTMQAAGIYAGNASGEGYVAADNYVTVNNGTFQGYTFISPGIGNKGSDALRGELTINDGEFEDGAYLFGGRAYTTGNVSYNTVTVNDGVIGGNKAYIWGGKADDGNATYNTVNLTGGEVAASPVENASLVSGFSQYEAGDAEFYGGFSLTGEAAYNQVNISGGSISTTGTGLVYGGYSKSGNANFNSVNVSGGNISSKLTLIGGLASGGDATGNTVNLRGGSGNGGAVYLHGGMTMSSTGNATNNTIAIYIPAGLQDVSGGTYVTTNASGDFVYNTKSDGDLFTGNELYLASSGISANNIYNFETLAFHLPSTYQASSTMLTLTGAEDTDLTGANIVLSAEGSVSLARGETINLISAQGNISYDGKTTGTLKQGVSLSYPYTLNNDSHRLQAVLGEAAVTGETKSPVETRAAQAAFLNRGADLLAAEGLQQAETASRSGNKAAKGEWSPFFAAQGGKYRYQTGSHVDSRNFSAVLGFAKENELRNGTLLYGLAGEYGKGSYDSYYENMHGEGDSDYAGVAAFVRRTDSGGMYYEGSLRAGRTKADYSSRNFTGYEGINIGYDTDSSYWGAHLGLGKAIQMNGRNELNVSLRYFYSRTGSDSVRLSTGETYNFSAVSSHRLRLGARLTHAFNEQSKGYVGAYYEHEFDGEAKATVVGYSTAAPSLKGGSGIFEIGWRHQPKNSSFTLGLGATFACGKQRGGAGQVSLLWKF
ncbi:MAG: autotransporter domain-containing protein [Selenomonadaceae bacterium]|nr:autotransporter domain-containing protein [Selenomonadaceae bacterium]